MTAFLFTLLALSVTVILVEVARRLAPSVGLIDSPNERKVHEGDIPLVGGIAIFAGIVLVLTFKGSLADHWAFFLAAGLLVATGMWDDRFGVAPHPRLIIQGLAVLIIAVPGKGYISDLGTILPILGTLSLGWMTIPFTVFAGVGLINAFNMSDGVDGLCGTLTLVALTGLGIAAGMAGRETELMLILALAGAVLGFLMFNVRLPQRKRALVFLGDAGSYLMGLSVIYLAMRLTQGQDRAINPVTALWFCMLPIFDIIGMILRRVRRGQSPFSADREHLHHVFLLAKFSVTATWMALTVVATSGMIIGLTGYYAGVSESIMFALFLVLGAAYYVMLMRSWKVLRFLSRSINRRKVAKVDRRVDGQRRIKDIGFFVDGVRVERRSGSDRRQGNGSRRNDEEYAPSELTNLVASNSSSKTSDHAARVS
ncbi:MAG: UDP-N-acetylglucosamine--undecaprenyl-phosphate N-acetylglucosaminephosphotransferase [Woeseiaceae bacterium]